MHQVRLDAPNQTLWALGTTVVALTDFPGKYGRSDAFLAALNLNNLNTDAVSYYGGDNDDEGYGLTLANGTPCMVGTFVGAPDSSLNFMPGTESNLQDMAIWCRTESIFGSTK